MKMYKSYVLSSIYQFKSISYRTHSFTSSGQARQKFPDGLQLLKMPRTASAKKSLRVSLKKTSTNKRRKAVIKAALKNVSDQTSKNKAFSMVDKGVKWGIYHKNKAARLKSKISKLETTEKVEKPKKVTKAVKAPVKKTVKKATK